MQAVLARLDDDAPDQQVTIVRSALAEVIAKRVVAASTLRSEREADRRAAEARADERSRWRREVHDRLGSDASLAVRTLDLYEVLADRDPPGASLLLGELRRTLGELIGTVRALLADGRMPPAQVELDSALRSFVAGMDPACRVSVRVMGPAALLPADCRQELFMVLREALRNVFAHADARKASVVVLVGRDSVRASVRDDGRGFDQSEIPAERHIGLASIRERVALVDGRIDLHTSPGRGTRVEIVVPIPGGEVP